MTKYEDTQEALDHTFGSLENDPKTVTSTERGSKFGFYFYPLRLSLMLWSQNIHTARTYAATHIKNTHSFSPFDPKTLDRRLLVLVKTSSRRFEKYYDGILYSPTMNYRVINKAIRMLIGQREESDTSLQTGWLEYRQDLAIILPDEHIDFLLDGLPENFDPDSKRVFDHDHEDLLAL